MRGKDKMSDRDRVLMNIAVKTAGSVHDKMRQLDIGWSVRFLFDRPAPQFVPAEMADQLGMPMKPGDIVRCQTNPYHRWGIAELVKCYGFSDFVLREIGGDALFNMGNESLDVLRFMPESLLYTGAKYRIHEWASGKAFRRPHNPDADHFKRCGGVKFDGDTLIVWSRPHVFGAERQQKGGPTLYAQPRKFTLPWGEKTRLKDIVNAMREQGFAEDFEYAPEEPTEGQSGYAKFTRADIERILKI